MSSDFQPTLAYMIQSLNLDELITFKKTINHELDNKIIELRNIKKTEKSVQIRNKNILKKYLNKTSIKKIANEFNIADYKANQIINNLKRKFINHYQSIGIEIDKELLDQKRITNTLKKEFIEYIEKETEIKFSSNPVTITRLENGLDTPIMETNMSMRTKNCLSSNSFKTMREVANTSHNNLRRINNLGAKSLKEIHDFIHENLDLNAFDPLFHIHKDFR